MKNVIFGWDTVFRKIIQLIQMNTSMMRTMKNVWPRLESLERKKDRKKEKKKYL